MHARTVSTRHSPPPLHRAPGNEANARLASFPGQKRRRRRKGLISKVQRFKGSLVTPTKENKYRHNHGEIPPLLHIINTHPTSRDVITTLQCLFSHTSSDVEDPDHCPSYALHQLDSPELRPKPKQRYAIESVYRGEDAFGW